MDENGNVNNWNSYLDSELTNYRNQLTDYLSDISKNENQTIVIPLTSIPMKTQKLNKEKYTFIKAYIVIVIIYSILRWKFGYGMGIGLDLFGVSIGLWVISEFLYRFWSPSMRLLSGFIGFLVLMLISPSSPKNLITNHFNF